FLANRERDSLVGDEALEHFAKRTAALARKHRGDVDGRKDALAREGVGEQRAVLDFLTHAVDVDAELGVSETGGEQVEGFEDRQSGANERDELLIEDQEFFGIEFLAASALGERTDFRARLDGIDEEALLGKAISKLALGAGLGHLLMDFAARVGILQ